MRKIISFSLPPFTAFVTFVLFVVKNPFPEINSRSVQYDTAMFHPRFSRRGQALLGKLVVMPRLARLQDLAVLENLELLAFLEELEEKSAWQIWRFSMAAIS